MAKQRRSAQSRGSVRAAVGRAPARKPKPRLADRTTAAAVIRPSPARESALKEAPPPPPPPRRPAFYEALALYESGVRALQRHDFQSGAEGFRGVIQGYPGERELVERARLYLQVCEREHAKRGPAPQTVSEWVYAATLALNAGDQEGALSHLGRALDKAPDSDHAHYIMAVALADKGDSQTALRHLHRAIRLNPDNRAMALQDPDLSALRDLDGFRDAVGAAGSETLTAARRRVRARR
jgi:tetratricopeptide (TPR) repeat protein